MYIYIQQKINKFMIGLFIFDVIVFVVLYFMYMIQLISIGVFAVLLIVIAFLYHYILRFVEQNLEHRTIYNMLKNKQFTLATIKSLEFYKESRDSAFKKQFIYKFHIVLKTLNGEEIESDIYENVNDSLIDCLPGDVYVTYDKDLRCVGIIPTLLLQMTPEVEDDVRLFESKYNTHYLVAIRKNGLSLKSISEVLKKEKKS